MIFLVIISVLILLIYLYISWNNNYWKERGIPHDEPKFFFGNLKDALTGKAHMHMLHCNLYNKYNKVPYVGFYKLRTPSIIIRDLDLVRDVLVKEFNKFAANDFQADPDVDPLLAENPFAVTGEAWKVKRHQWTSGMSLNKVKLMFDVMTEKAELTIKHMTEHQNEPVDVKNLSCKYLTDVIVASVLGMKVDSFEDPSNEFFVIASNLFTTDFVATLRAMCYFIAPWTYKYTGSGFVTKTVARQLMEISKQVIEIRMKNGFGKNDFFVTDKEEVSDIVVAGKVFGFLSDGIETSSGLISFALYELAVNPDIQTKLRQEINDSIEENNKKLTYEGLSALPLLDQVVNETLRLHPPAFSINRVCTVSYELPPIKPGGKPFTIPVGMPVSIPGYALSMDPEYFEDPKTFDPERFSPERKDEIKKHSFMPFGDGPRICVGQRLGLTNGKNCLAHIIKNFEVKLSPKTKVPLEINPQSFINRPIGDIWLTFHKIYS